LSDVTTNAADHAVFPAGSLTFAGGIVGETQTITVVVNGDLVVEGNETLAASLGTVTPAGIVAAASIGSGAAGTGTISNDDTEVLTISSPTITEGDSGTQNLTFTVTSPK